MSNRKTIKVPYHYTSDYFDTTKKYRWLPIIVTSEVTAKNFVPDIVPHSVDKQTFYLLERDCATIWLRGISKEPRQISSKEAMGILTLFDVGVPFVVNKYGGDTASIVQSINLNEYLSDENSAVFITALTDYLAELADANKKA